jgi:hypothetical protein
MFKSVSTAMLLACALLGPGADRAAAQGGALPGLLPVGTVDKAFNDAADDLRIERWHFLTRCADQHRYFGCTYTSTSGIGIVAWAPRSEGVVEQLSIAIPPCRVEPELRKISAILIHIFSPRRPQTFSRPIVAMAQFAASSGSGEHWLDGVSYVLLDRRHLGVGLIVRRSQRLPDVAPDSSRARTAAARKVAFYLPPIDCAAPIVAGP